jgi:ribosome-associated translation inhibitor RaiA
VSAWRTPPSRPLAVASVRTALATALAADRAPPIRARPYAEPTREGAPMSGIENSPTGPLEERLRLGAGFAAADRPRILGALSALAPHLSGWEHDQVDLEVSAKDREGPDQKVTLQAWLAGRAHLVATSHERDLDHALAEVRRELIRQIEDERSRREPRKRRKTRKSTA